MTDPFLTRTLPNPSNPFENRINSVCMKSITRYGLMLLLVVCSAKVKAQVPLYNSYPSASAVIFLDFDGHTVTGTSWNTYIPTIQCGGSGLDNVKISEIFNRVAEDYRPFNVNITTDSTKFLAAPLNKRTRVIVTTSSSWFGPAGGVALVGSFIWGDDSPCFVFSALLNYSVKKVSEAIAHEAGHTLGLYHQSTYDAVCTKVTDYNEGVGTGEIGWAPIMGVGYSKNFTLWNNGPNSFSCTEFQSDLDIITTGNGFGYRTDDHANTNAASTIANFTNNQFVVNGVVERNTDQDMIRFIIPEDGRFQLDAIPYNVGTGNAGSDLDMQVTLITGSNTVLNIYNPGALLNSVVDTVLNAGTYYLRVEGRGNQYAPAYASLGSYSIQGRFTADVTLPLHKLELAGGWSGNTHSLNWEIIADEQIVSLIVEVSTNGRTFSQLARVDNNTRGFAHVPATTNGAQYRLNVTFDNDRQYYSNVINIRPKGAPVKPQVVGNVITSNIIKVTSPGKYNYQVYDMHGKSITKGQLTNGTNTITTPSLLNGMYIIRFNDDQQHWTDKIIRQ